MNAADIYGFAVGRKLGVLATRSEEGIAQSALIGYAITPSLEIIFDTLSTSRKYRNLKFDSACSLVIGLDDAITVQYQGVAGELMGAELEQYKPLYFEVWPEGPDRELLPDIAYFLVKPRWIRYSDFNQSPPFIEELTLPLGF